MNPIQNKTPNQEMPNQTLSTDDESSSNSLPPTSATTTDSPSFGWSAYAERINGRFAMIGFMAVLLIEAINNQSFLNWVGVFR